MRRILGGLLIVVLSLAAVIAVVLVLQSRDDAEVGSGGGPGEKVAARCPDQPAGVTRDARPLSEDQIRHSLALGNVVLRYAGGRPPAALRELQDELTGPFDAEIAAAGQAVDARGRRQDASRRWPGAAGSRRARPGDPALRTFAEAWLGEGAPEPCRS